LREARQLSQEKLASLLGVSTSTVIRWEQGIALPTGTAAAVLLAMIVGPVGLATMITLGPLALTAYGIYRALKEVFEAKQPEEKPKTPESVVGPNGGDFTPGKRGDKHDQVA
jgi:transcriptional regulator with XRE-family HTH domain